METAKILGLTLKCKLAEALPSVFLMVVGSKVMLKSSLSPGGRALTLSMRSTLNPVPSSMAWGTEKEMGVYPLLMRQRERMGMADP